eukprot:gnl/TRDRNA2_/TRDRNA2_159511_c0_seq1.p1 gnl/TRDRNA2_/TRDRNA2_159511_c0~~gnl/TRDRNA2_/TRDRNA2_159511_c0_seq1.p1  ORF type:complete len:208 (+),score=41.50 gnl/TRDRNA2_/TRDRNA2_159511_c0_seq1:215-838(+)
MGKKAKGIKSLKTEKPTKVPRWKVKKSTCIESIHNDTSEWVEVFWNHKESGKMNKVELLGPDALISLRVDLNLLHDVCIAYHVEEENEYGKALKRKEICKEVRASKNPTSRDTFYVSDIEASEKGDVPMAETAAAAVAASAAATSLAPVLSLDAPSTRSALDPSVKCVEYFIPVVLALLSFKLKLSSVTNSRSQITTQGAAAPLMHV